MGANVTWRGITDTTTDAVASLREAGYSIGSAERRATTVLDTFDGRLHHDGLRLDHAAPALTLHDGGGRPAHTVAARAPRFATDLLPGPLRSRLAGIIEVRALLPVATVRTVAQRAERRDNRDDKITSAVTIHHELAVDDRPVPGWLVTIEAITGYAKAEARGRDLLEPFVAEPTGADAVDAMLALAGIDRAGRHVEPGIELDPQIAAGKGFRLVLANLADAVEVNCQGTIDDVDSEFLHDLRVAVRRSRSILRHGRHVLDPDVLAWAEPGLRLVGDVTSPPRDLDVQVLEWDDATRALDDSDRQALEPLRRQLERDREAAHVELAAQLLDGEASAVLRRWHATVHSSMDPARSGPDGAEPLTAVVRARIDKAQSTLLEHGRAITPDTPAEDVHDVRKDAKKLRYLLECFAGLFPSGGRKAFVKRLKKLQDLLGEHQDAEVHAAELRHAADLLPADTAPATYVAVGRLVEHLERARQEARDRFDERFSEYDSKGTRQVLCDMLDGATG